MRILHVITTLDVGGAEHLMVDLLPRLAAFDNQVDILLFNGVDTSFKDELKIYLECNTDRRSATNERIAMYARKIYQLQKERAGG